MKMLRYKPFEKIPTACKQPPKLESLKCGSASCTTVIFDLETTGLQSFAQITQIAAATMDGSRKFSCFVLPTISISPAATKVTGLSLSRKDGKCVK